MNCADLRDAFLEGKLPDDAEVARHVAECATCRALLDIPDLGRLLAREHSALPLAAPAIEQRVADVLARERGLRAGLRALPTAHRVGLALLAVVVLVAAQVLGRASLASPRHLELMAILLLLACVGLLSTARARSPWENRALVVGVVGFPLGLWLAQGTSGVISGSAVTCFAYGGVFALPFVGLLSALDRRDRVPPLDAALLGATGGLLAALILELECASRHLPHLLAGHAGVGWALIAALVGARWLRAR